MNELKPCPFCGGEADYYLGDGGYVQCSHCLATIPYRYELPYGEGKKQAITAWNRRPVPENKPLTLEQLRQMDGEPVWIDDWFEDFHGWELSTDASDYLDGRDLAQYGSRWLAYARKPEA